MAGLAQYSDFFQNPLFTNAIREYDIPQKYMAARFLPRVDTYDTDWNETIITRQHDMADIVDSGAELPLTDRDPLRRVSGEIVDIGQSYIVTKKELAALATKGNPGMRRIAEKQLLGKAAMIKQNLDARIEWMGWQAMANGILVYDKSGIQLSVDFGVNMKKTAGVRWNDVAPTILADYEGWVQEYIDKNGFAPDVYVTSSKAIRIVLNNTDVRKAITGYSDKLLTLAELNSFLVGRNLPKMEAFDSNVTYRDVTTGGSRTTNRLLADNKGLFLMESGQIGSQMMGPTQENDMNPGIFAQTITMERPKREIIEVVAASFPKIEYPDYIGITTILV